MNMYIKTVLAGDGIYNYSTIFTTPLSYYLYISLYIYKHTVPRY